MDKYFVGTQFELITTYDDIEKRQTYMLCEVNEEDVFFQIICISGYNAGKLIGFVNEQLEMKEKGYKAISKSFFEKEIERNFLFKKGSLKIME